MLKSGFLNRGVLLCISLCLLVACSKNVSQKEGEKKQEKEPTLVQVQQVVPQIFTTVLELTSETEPERYVTLKSKTGGTIEAIYPEVGDYVNQGDVLIQIDAKLAKAQYEASLLQFAISETNFKRQKTLFDHALISTQNFEQAEMTYKSSLAQKDVAQIQYDNAIMKAPFSGYVSTIPAQENNVIAVGEPLLTLIDYSTINVQVGCSQNDIAYIKKNQKVSVYIPSLEKNYEGEVVFVGIQADPVSKTFPVKIKIKNPKLAIRSGVIAEVKLVTRAIPNALVLRQDYVLEKKVKKVVVVQADGKAQFREVVLGERNNDRVHIESGLQPNEWIVVEGQGKLEENQSIRTEGSKE